MEKLKKIVLTSAFVGFSTLAIYNSFGDREELDLNSAKVNDTHFGENSIKNTQDLFLKSFLKQDLSQEEVKDALESISYFKKLLQKDYYNSGDLNQINNSFIEHIEKYIDENKMEEFKKVIYQKLDFSQEPKVSTITGNSGELENEDSIDNEDNENISKYYKEYYFPKKEDLPKIQNIPDLSNKNELIMRAKKEILDKYSKLINSIPEEKLSIILEKITLKITQIKDSNLTQEKKEKSIILLTALSEIINERIDSFVTDISIEDLLK